MCTGAEEHGWTEAGGSRAGLRAEAGSRVQADEPQFERYAQPHAGDRQLGAFGGPTPGRQGQKQESFPPCVAQGQLAAAAPSGHADRGSIARLRWAILGSRVCSFTKQGVFLG